MRRKGNKTISRNFMEEKNTKIVYSLRVHMELQRLGFIALNVMPNPYKKSLKCWVYEATPDMLEAFNRLMRRCKDGKC